MPKLRINGIEVEVERGTTVLEAATLFGIPIPTICHDDGPTPYGACRLCVVEVGVPPRSKLQVACTLGAERGDVFRLVLAQGIRMTILGVGVGLAGAWAVTRSLDALLLEVTANDPLTYVEVSLLLGGVALAACYFPARRATKVNPSVALRCE